MLGDADLQLAFPRGRPSVRLRQACRGIHLQAGAKVRCRPASGCPVGRAVSFPLAERNRAEGQNARTDQNTECVFACARPPGGKHKSQHSTRPVALNDPQRKRDRIIHYYEIAINVTLQRLR